MTDSLAHVVSVPDGEPWGGLVILHGAGSRKENHADMAAAAVAAGMAVVGFDARGHGDTGGRADGRAIEDVAAAAALLPDGLPVALRGSSMGGYMALIAASAAGAAAVVAICPAPARLLLDGLRDGSLRFEAGPEFAELLAAHPLEAAVGALAAPVLIQHAEGDEQVPVSGSRALARLFRHPASRLETFAEGDHRSVQHSASAQASALAWLRGQLRH
jgi:pimeloyl-ACP methyl ester carboxylesterase